MATLLEKLSLMMTDQARASRDNLPREKTPNCRNVTREEMLQIFKNELRFNIHPAGSDRFIASGGVTGPHLPSCFLFPGTCMYRWAPVN